MQISAPLFLQSSSGRGRPPAIQSATSNVEGASLDAAILIVEDESLIAWTLCDMLEEEGFSDLRIACNAVEAIASAEERHPDLLICDVNLGGGKDGIDTAAHICASEQVPVLFITGYAGEEIRARIDHRVGAAPLMRKPITLEPLLKKLQELLGRPTPN
jgi:CheY-like chemotaxis protein